MSTIVKEASGVREALILLLIYGLSVSIGLAWSYAFESYFEKNYPKYGRWVYAIVLTVLGAIAVVVGQRYVS